MSYINAVNFWLCFALTSNFPVSRSNLAQSLSLTSKSSLSLPWVAEAEQTDISGVRRSDGSGLKSAPNSRNLWSAENELHVSHLKLLAQIFKIIKNFKIVLIFSTLANWSLNYFRVVFWNKEHNKRGVKLVGKWKLASKFMYEEDFKILNLRGPTCWWHGMG